MSSVLMTRVAIGLGVALLGTFATTVYLYRDNNKLSGEVSSAELAYNLKESEVVTLQEKYDRLKLDLKEITATNEKLDSDITHSKEVIKQINNDRELLLQRIRNEDVDPTCKALFQWMKEKSYEI